MHFMQLKNSVLLTMLCTFFLSLWGALLINNSASASTVCLDGSCDYTSIWKAIGKASSGETIVVGPGTYYETIRLIKNVNLVSAGDDSTTDYTDGTYTTTVLQRAKDTIIDGGGETSILVTCPEGAPTLDGFTIQNISGDDTFLVTIGDGSPTIKNNIIRNNSGSGHSGGIGLQGFGTGAPSPLIENNFIHNVYGPGIGNGPYSYATIRYNEIWDCRGDQGPGIGLYRFAAPTIENNTIFGNERAGIGCYNAEFVNGLTAGGGTLTIPTIKGNTIYDNTEAGIRLSREFGDTGTINVTIGDNVTCNDIYGNKVGIRLDNLTTASIENNNVYNSTIKSGLALFGVTNVTVNSNRIYNNEKCGMRLEKIDSIIISNNIIYDNMQPGIRFSNDTGTTGTANLVGNEIYGNGVVGIRNVGATTFTMQYTNIYSNGYSGINIDCPSSINTIQDCCIYDNIKAGIIIEKADSVTIQNSHINNNGLGGINNGGINDLMVSGNHIYGNGYGGINIKSGTGTISDNNIIEQNSRGGIAIKAPCTFEITGNQINGNLRGGIHTGEDSADGGGYNGAVGDAHLTIKKNKVYGNGQSGFGGGIDVRHADGVIYNNLVYENHMGGIRFGDYIDEIVNNTVVGNGENDMGGGIVYDNLEGAVNDSPAGCAPDDIPIKNNICTDNENGGVFVNICSDNTCPVNRNYNLLCRNNGITDDECGTSQYCIRKNLGTCYKNDNEIFFDPLFVDPGNDDYHLQLGSEAKNAGDNGFDMGAYGGADPITP